MHFLFQSPPTPPLAPFELCNDFPFEIFFHLLPKVLPCFTCLKKQSSAIVTSPLLQKTYWTQKLCLPRVYAMVYSQHRLTNRICFALTRKDYDQRLNNKSELNRFRQVPHFRFPSSSYTRLPQWTENVLQYYKIGAHGVRIQNLETKEVAKATQMDAMGNYSSEEHGGIGENCKS